MSALSTLPSDGEMRLLADGIGDETARVAYRFLRRNPEGYVRAERLKLALHQWRQDPDHFLRQWHAAYHQHPSLRFMAFVGKPIIHHVINLFPQDTEQRDVWLDRDTVRLLVNGVIKGPDQLKAKHHRGVLWA